MASGRVSVACQVLARVHILSYLPHKCWLTHSPVSLLVGSSAFFQCSFHKSPVAMWFSNPTHLSYERTGLACSEFELQHGVFLINLSHGQLGWLSLHWEAQARRVVGNGLTRRQFCDCAARVRRPRFTSSSALTRGRLWQVIWLLGIQRLRLQNEGIKLGGHWAFFFFLWSDSSSASCERKRETEASFPPR